MGLMKINLNAQIFTYIKFVRMINEALVLSNKYDKFIKESIITYLNQTINKRK